MLISFISQRFDIREFALKSKGVKLHSSILKHFLGNTVTVMSPEGTPIQVNANALQSVAAQNAFGRLTSITIVVPSCTRIVNFSLASKFLTLRL